MKKIQRAFHLQQVYWAIDQLAPPSKLGQTQEVLVNTMKLNELHGCCHDFSRLVETDGPMIFKSAKILGPENKYVLGWICHDWLDIDGFIDEYDMSIPGEINEADKGRHICIRVKSHDAVSVDADIEVIVATTAY